MTTTNDSEPEPSSPPPYVDQEPRYVYYRVYTPDGAIPSMTAPDPGNPFIGRIKATSVPPPQTVLSLKRALGKAENLPDPEGCRTSIYELPSQADPLGCTEKIAIIEEAGVGATPATALALVFNQELSEKEKERCLSNPKAARSYTPEYVYYRLHTLEGEDRSTRAFNANEPAIGRVDTTEIAPPLNVMSLKRCIARAEGKPIYSYGHLYGDPRETEPWSDQTYLNWQKKGTFPGPTPTAPLLVVQPERREGLYNRPLKILEPQEAGWTSFWSSNLKWLAASKGQIVHTDGIPLNKDHRGRASRVDGYMAVCADGETGLIQAENTKFLDE
ncbi:hypothetical protein C8R43DRAFT_1061440 [Mycena crocata]|nr:hypothetical protein C8R43DRAFT_1061440 [Mycena crocata]